VQYELSTATTYTTATSSTNSLSIAGLSASSFYDFQVQSVCSSTSNSAYSGNNSFQTLIVCNDVFEPNNTLATAAAISVNMSYVAIKNVSTDIDCYKFTTTANQPKVKVTMTNLPANYNLRLYSGSTLLATSANTGTTSETIIYNTATTGGTYTIKVYGSAYNASSCYTFQAQVSSSNFRLENPNTTSNSSTSLNLYPNPANQQLSVVFTSNVEQATVLLNVYDLTGKQISTQSQTAYEGDNTYVLDINSLANGMYIIEVNDGVNRQMQKFVVQH